MLKANQARSAKRDLRLDDKASVLAWTLSRRQQERVTTETLNDFHGEIEMCLNFFGAKVLADSSSSGLLLGMEMNNGQMSPADTLVRLGQHLCRWANQQSPPFGLRIGVDVGQLRQMSLPNSGGRPAYFGSACAGARRLAEVAEKESVVHLARRVKDELSALRHLRMTLSPTHSCYYLDPSTEVVSEHLSGCALAESVAPMLAMDLREQKTAEERSAKMPYSAFRDLLEKHNVDTSKFGRGSAKSLQEFYDAVVRDQKSYLIVRDDHLERIVELVRISLRTRGRDNRMRELKIRSEPNAEGGVRMRNQPLAMVIDQATQGQWQEAIERCFQLKFGLSVQEQKAYFAMDKKAYSFQEDRSRSDTIPGIMTTYKKHNIILSIKDKAKAQLDTLGLPGANDFTTTTGAGSTTWTWASVEDDQEDELLTLLQNNGIDPSEFTWQAFTQLYEEVYVKKQSCLECHDGEVVRTIRIIKVRLHADILNVDHVLVVRSKHQKGSLDVSTQDAISMRMSVGADWEESVAELLLLRLGINPDEQQRLFAVDAASHKVNEEIAYSRTFPGVKTLYEVNDVCVRVQHPQDCRLHFIGLPGGTDFTFARQEPIMKTGESDIVITTFGWHMSEDMETLLRGERMKQTMSFTRMPSLRDRAVRRRPTNGEAREFPGVQEEDDEDVMEAADSPGVDRVKSSRVSPPKALVMRESDELLLTKLMLNMQTDWLRARRAAEKVLDPDYSTKDFYQDVSHAFPELRLYCISRSHLLDGREITDTEQQNLSGARTADDEFQRTIGALFAVFWLMRLHLDGKDAFCFGLDVNWQTKTPPDEAEIDVLPEEMKKRIAFHRDMDWKGLEDLVVQAGLLKQPGGPHNPERTLAILVLMTIHDIMKLDVLQPKVSKAIEEFLGYKSGETIGDHDVALSYVLEHCASALPSFAGLPKEQQAAVKFTHCKLDYNMGWLVQGEAPPGALFKSFRKVITDGAASASDIAFYFVHWFTDLAGAEPYPMQGCEKFVLKFPRKVLQSFVDSFPVVWTLSPEKNETQVFEDYLAWRWGQHDPPLGPPPTGKGSIASMRLVLMAQGDSSEVLKQFRLLPLEDYNTIAGELAMTGLQEQSFERDNLEGSKCAGKGPAILVYYAPALMQKCGRVDPGGAMQVLSEVLRRARELWPLSTEPQEVNRTVTIRIDALKDLSIPEIRHPASGHSFVIVKSSNRDGLVKLMPVSSFRELDWAAHQILTFSEQKSKRTNLVITGGESSGRLVAGISHIPRFLKGMSRSQEENLS